MAVDAIDDAPNPTVAALLLLRSNDMFDIVTTRSAATQVHPPGVVWLMLGGRVLECSMLVGYDLGGDERKCCTC